ncbi:MAG: enoyl-CoA hydratase [Pseudomonadales bacterium]|nr:enoyl-CoA hydratase [Pseudomonadales bacterium]
MRALTHTSTINESKKQVKKLESNVILIEKDEGVTTVTLNRPEALNALSVELRGAIARTFVELKADAETRVIILTGAGKAFSAGLDLKELGEKGFGSSKDSVTDEDLAAAVCGVGKPVIGAINGYAITGGFELALMCDILIASTEAKFADTHVHMGVVPGWGLSQRLAALIGASRAKELSFTGNYLDAETAERWGLVNRVLPGDKLLPHCRKLAKEICSGDPATLAEIHRLIDFGRENTLGEGLKEESRASIAHRQNLTTEKLANRREPVQTRGRDQTRSRD